MINSSVVRTPSPSSSMRCTASTERPGWVATQVNVRIGCSLVTVHTIGRPFGWVTRYRLPTANGPVSRRSISRMDFVQAGQPSTSTSNSHTRAAGACTISSRMYRIRHLPFDRHHRTDEPDDSGWPGTVGGRITVRAAVFAACRRAAHNENSARNLSISRAVYVWQQLTAHRTADPSKQRLGSRQSYADWATTRSRTG
ncbi:hypothetical protein BZL30_3897 [Mycobacterium kansasii]|nr:hypothetical protein BZL30_3897 [Mycobacterium kansasii]